MTGNLDLVAIRARIGRSVGNYAYPGWSDDMERLLSEVERLREALERIVEKGKGLRESTQPTPWDAGYVAGYSRFADEVAAALADPGTEEPRLAGETDQPDRIRYQGAERWDTEEPTCPTCGMTQMGWLKTYSRACPDPFHKRGTEEPREP